MRGTVLFFFPCSGRYNRFQRNDQLTQFFHSIHRSMHIDPTHGESHGDQSFFPPKTKCSSSFFFFLNPFFLREAFSFRREAVGLSVDELSFSRRWLSTGICILSKYSSKRTGLWPSKRLLCVTAEQNRAKYRAPGREVASDGRFHGFRRLLANETVPSRSC